MVAMCCAERKNTDVNNMSSIASILSFPSRQERRSDSFFSPLVASVTQVVERLWRGREPDRT